MQGLAPLTLQLCSSVLADLTKNTFHLPKDGYLQVPEASILIGDAGNSRGVGAQRGNGDRQHRSWPSKFLRYRKKIIELWAKSHVPLVHRSYFFLLFKGDSSDNVYMEVELRRLYFLKDTSARRTNTMIDTQIVSPTAR